jgi:hypothetical protein
LGDGLGDATGDALTRLFDLHCDSDLS